MGKPENEADMLPVDDRTHAPADAAPARVKLVTQDRARALWRGWVQEAGYEAAPFPAGLEPVAHVVCAHCPQSLGVAADSTTWHPRGFKPAWLVRYHRRPFWQQVPFEVVLLEHWRPRRPPRWIDRNVTGFAPGGAYVRCPRCRAWNALDVQPPPMV